MAMGPQRAPAACCVVGLACHGLILASGRAMVEWSSSNGSSKGEARVNRGDSNEKNRCLDDRLLGNSLVHWLFQS